MYFYTNECVICHEINKIVQDDLNTDELINKFDLETTLICLNRLSQLGCYTDHQQQRLGLLISSVEAKLVKPLEILGQSIENSGRDNEELLSKLASLPVFKYASKEEMLQVVNATSATESLQEVSAKVANGEWELLLETYGQEKDLSYLLLAAYANEQIDLEDLATGMMLHRAYLNDPSGLTIYRIDGEMNKNLGFSSKQLIKIASKIKENQRFFFTVKKTPEGFAENFDDWTETMGIFYFTTGDVPEYGIASFGLAKTWYPTLTPRLHLTPNLLEMAKNLLNKEDDFGIFVPGEEVTVHGYDDHDIFSFQHELFHARIRNNNRSKGVFYGEVLNVLQLQEKLFNIRPKYELKLHSEDEDAFVSRPTDLEFACYIMDRVSGMYLDGINFHVKVKFSKSIIEEFKLQT